MQRNRYTSEFKEQAMSKARQRGARALESVANELNMSLDSLKGWLKASNYKVAEPATPASLPSDTAAQLWSPAQRLLALNESHALQGAALQGAALHAWCREKGLFEHQLKQWREAFCSTSESTQHQAKTELRELKVKNEQLQRDLRRKDRALAETAALLVLQKKFRALLEDEDK
ncbi:MAG: transposase [Burkholderiaceae bacterium]|nr:transposase [Burkholderiaceae bacterium]